MRPTDEHQSPSTRPNFMSAARHSAGSSDNILARLERGSHPRRRLWSRKKIAGGVAGAAVMLSLVWLLAGLAQENLQVHSPREVIVTAVTPTAPERTATAAHTATIANPAESDLSLEPAVTMKIEAPAVGADDALVEPTLTPLPLLAEVVEAPAPAPLKQARPASRPAAPAKAAPKPPRVAAARGAPPSRGATADASIDNDVALLSAILINAPRHSAERARTEAACSKDKKCQPGAAALLLKTTD